MKQNPGEEAVFIARGWVYHWNVTMGVIVQRS